LLVDNMKEHLKGLVLLEGTASERINDLMGDFDNTHKYFNNMESAVKKAYELAKDGDMVILCPSASSFNMFLNEFDRGDQYVKYVNLLK